MEKNGILTGDRLSLIACKQSVLNESVEKRSARTNILNEFKQSNAEICAKIGVLISEGYISKKEVSRMLKESAVFVIQNNHKKINESTQNFDFIVESLILERTNKILDESWIGDKLSSAWNGIKGAAKSVGNWVGDKATKAANWVGDRAKDVGKWAKNKWENLDIRLAIADGVLPDNFECDSIEVATYNNNVALHCHNSRRWFWSEDFVLLKGGTGIYLKDNRKFKWTSVMAVKVSMKDAIIGGAFLGGSVAALPAALAGGSALAATGAVGFAALDAADLAGTLTGAEAKRDMDAAKEEYADLYGGSDEDYGEYDDNTYYADNGYESYDDYEDDGVDDGSDMYDQFLAEEKQQLNEFVITATLVGAAIGAIGCGIYAAVKNQGNVIYKSDGTYASKDGKLSGKWDGTAERDEIVKQSKQQISEQKENSIMKNNEYDLLKEFIEKTATDSIDEAFGLNLFKRAGKAGKAAKRAGKAGKAGKAARSSAKNVKRAINTTRKLEKIKSGMAAMRKSIAADRQIAQQELKKSKDILAKIKKGVDKNGKALSKQQVESMTRWATEHQKRHAKMMADITKREKFLLKQGKRTKEMEAELKALQSAKSELNATMKTTKAAAVNISRARKILGMTAAAGLIGAAAYLGGRMGADDDDTQATDAAGSGGSTGGSVDGNGAGGAGGTGTDPQEIERVKKMQTALNAAGYECGPVDGIIGPRTKAAAQEAGIDYRTWNGTPEIKPKQQNQQGQEQQQQDQGQQQGFDYSSDAAYGKYLGGADAREIKKFQYDFGIEPETGVYDAKTAGKAYELAHDTNDNNFKRAGGTIKAYANWNAYEAGGNAANAQHAQNAATEAFNSALQALNASLDKYGKGNPAANERLNNIRNFLKNNDFDGAMQAANSLAQIVAKKNIMQQIEQCKQAYEAANKNTLSESAKRFSEKCNDLITRIEYL